MILDLLKIQFKKTKRLVPNNNYWSIIYKIKDRATRQYQAEET